MMTNPRVLAALFPTRSGPRWAARVPFGFDPQQHPPGTDWTPGAPLRSPRWRAGAFLDERATCERAAEQVTRDLGFDCHDVSPVVSVHNPFDLASWTMPVLELLIIAGAVFALVHAVRRFRAGRPDQPGAVVRAAGLPVGHRAAAVLPGVVRPRQAVRLHLRPQHLHGAVHVGPAAALHHRDLSGDDLAGLRARAGARDLPGRGRPGRAGRVAFVCQSSTRSSTSSAPSWGGGHGTTPTRTSTSPRSPPSR